MDARTNILKTLRANQPPAAELPSLEGPWITYQDPREQFCAAVLAAGARAVRVASIEHVRQELDQQSTWNEAKEIYAAVPGIERANVALDSIKDPHEMQSLDFAILPGEFAVAENGAVWVANLRSKHRVTSFITQHLALVVPGDQIVHNMHQAYDRLNFDVAGFGVFISGPSKTADIEQSLVIGAHGARSLTVFLLES